MKTEISDSSAKESTGVRLTKEMRARIKELAAERRWTMSAYIEWALEQHVEAIDAASKSSRSQKRS